MQNVLAESNNKVPLIAEDLLRFYRARNGKREEATEMINNYIVSFI